MKFEIEIEVNQSNGPAVRSFLQGVFAGVIFPDPASKGKIFGVTDDDLQITIEIKDIIPGDVLWALI